MAALRRGNRTRRLMIALSILLACACSFAQGGALTRVAHAQPNLIVSYDFEGDFLSSGTVIDRSGNGYDATLVGAVAPTQGIAGGQAAAFSGHSYIRVAQNPAAGRTTVSFSLWFVTANPDENYKLASAAWWSGGPASGWIIATHIPEFWSDDTQSLFQPGFVNNDNQFLPGQWTHEVVTYDGQHLREYTNGRLVNDWAATGAALGAGSPMAVGGWPDFNGYDFQGAIDAFQIFDDALSPAEIQALYAAGAAQQPALSLPAAPAGQYSDPLAITVTADDPDTPAADIVFSVAGLPTGLALTSDGDGTASIAGALQAPAGAYTSQISVGDPTGLRDTDELVFTITPEDATLSYNGDSSAEAGAPLALRAQLTEADDGSPGDLTRAAVIFDLADSAGATTSYGPAATSAAGAARYTLPGGLPAGDYTVVARLDTAGGFYVAPDSAPEGLHIQAPPLSGPTCNGAPATIVGTKRRDLIRGTPGADVIVGLGGGDSIFGLGGDDLICGGDGDDALFGGDGDDALFGGDGDDTLHGDQAGAAGEGGRRRSSNDHHPAHSGGNDQLFGDAGNDRLFGDGGDDALNGGAGKDQLDGGDGDYDQLFGGDSNDRLIDGDGVSAAHGGAGRDMIAITLRAGWRAPDGQRRFSGALSGGYGDDSVTLALLNPRPLFIDITGDERDAPPSSLEGKHDRLHLRGARVTRDSLIIKFERR